MIWTNRCKRAGWRALAPAVVAALTLSGCSGHRGAALSRGAAVAPQNSVPTTTTAPPEAEAQAGTTTTTEPPPGLGVGSEAAAVLALERKLEAMRYWVGQVDEAYDTDTRDAVVAFQKITGMERTGRATDDVLAAVNAAAAPPPMVPNGGPKRVEIDLERQVLFLFEANALAAILPVSTGSNERFCSEGWCRRAVTPSGSFVVYSQVSGWEKSPLGWLYNSQYFNGGIAIHGSPSVPGHPASHGCVRIPMNAAEWFPERVSLGMPVYVLSADAPNPVPIDPTVTPTNTPTTVVPDVPLTVAPRQRRTTTTSTTRNLLGDLLSPPTTHP